MRGWVTRMVTKLFPVLRLLRDHRDTLRQAAVEKESVYAKQHDIARRVHVLEWLQFPQGRPTEPQVPATHPRRRAGDRR